MEPLVAVKNLDIAFLQQGVKTHVVKDISFDIFPQEVLAIVGESGSGKSVTALSIMRLLPPPPYCTIMGAITYGQLDVLKLTEKQLRKIRGAGVAYIFQEPSTSFNPVFTIGYQVVEAIKLHLVDVDDVKAYAIQLLCKVGLDGQQCYGAYPHELSGGMQQRAMIAMALACKPRILIADEPTTALDMTIQKQIIELLKHLQRTEKLTIVLITHNFGIVKHFAQRVIVMFRGKIVEQGLSEQIVMHPQHPYTQALIACIPTIGQRKERLKTIDYSAF
ncbi:MAG: ABC transporter ATP-binding protein [Puniceicoccales bacterium]|jgi:ABC-type dipeptide/oligopeptide/nickel transport system ATPase component|nr:ABC transporter ATP-binding protein [Puniceicoccales bacterium]